MRMFRWINRVTRKDRIRNKYQCRRQYVNALVCVKNGRDERKRSVMVWACDAEKGNGSSLQYGYENER